MIKPTGNPTGQLNPVVFKILILILINPKIVNPKIINPKTINQINYFK